MRIGQLQQGRPKNLLLTRNGYEGTGRRGTVYRHHQPLPKRVRHQSKQRRQLNRMRRFFTWILGHCVDIFVNNLNFMRFGGSGLVHPLSKAVWGPPKGTDKASYERAKTSISVLWILIGWNELPSTARGNFHPVAQGPVFNWSGMSCHECQFAWRLPLSTSDSVTILLPQWAETRVKSTYVTLVSSQQPAVENVKSLRAA